MDQETAAYSTGMYLHSKVSVSTKTNPANNLISNVIP